MTSDRKSIAIEPPSAATILAARHLDATEGPVQIGRTVDTAARSAITTVLRYIATAHNSPTAPDLEGQRDGAYRERAQLLALLAALHPSVIAPAPDVEEPGWQILYLRIGGKQASWHIAPQDAELYAHVEHVPANDSRAQWDGHTTEEKYAHIGQHAARLYAEACSRVETSLPSESPRGMDTAVDDHRPTEPDLTTGTRGEYTQWVIETKLGRRLAVHVDSSPYPEDARLQLERLREANPQLTFRAVRETTVRTEEEW